MTRVRCRVLLDNLPVICGPMDLASFSLYASLGPNAAFFASSTRLSCSTAA